ncbi:MAG: autotransporter outer membrane beta-barrel domain-containing protein [Rickettsiales bacterium]|nr:MAG: autotransporter outer membrane beta-barrel domain-containing protein [Rickettsiales bacterium]
MIGSKKVIFGNKKVNMLLITSIFTMVSGYSEVVSAAYDGPPPPPPLSGAIPPPPPPLPPIGGLGASKKQVNVIEKFVPVKGSFLEKYDVLFERKLPVQQSTAFARSKGNVASVPQNPAQEFAAILEKKKLAKEKLAVEDSNSTVQSAQPSVPVTFTLPSKPPITIRSDADEFVKKIEKATKNKILLTKEQSDKLGLKEGATIGDFINQKIYGPQGKDFKVNADTPIIESYIKFYENKRTVGDSPLLSLKSAVGLKNAKKYINENSIEAIQNMKVERQEEQTIKEQMITQYYDSINIIKDNEEIETAKKYIDGINKILSQAKAFDEQEKKRLRDIEIARQMDPDVIAAKIKEKEEKKQKEIDEANQAIQTLMAKAKAGEVTNFHQYHSDLAQAQIKLSRVSGKSTIEEKPTMKAKELQDLIQRDIPVLPTDLFATPNFVSEDIKKYRVAKKKKTEEFFHAALGKSDLEKLTNQLKAMKDPSLNRLIEDMTDAVKTAKEQVAAIPAAGGLPPPPPPPLAVGGPPPPAIGGGLSLANALAARVNKATAPAPIAAAIPAAGEPSPAAAAATGQVPVKDMLEKMDALLGKTVTNVKTEVTLQSAIKDPRGAYNELRRQGLKKYLEEKSKAETEEFNKEKAINPMAQRKFTQYVEPSPQILKNHFEALVANGVLPNAEDIFDTKLTEKAATDDRVKKIVHIKKNHETIKLAQLKDSIASLLVNNPQHIEGLIVLIDQTGSFIAKELEKPLTDEQMELLATTEAIVEGLSEENVKKRKTARIDKVKQAAEKITEAKENREKGATYVEVAVSSVLETEVEDNTGKPVVKQDAKPESEAQPEPEAKIEEEAQPEPEAKIEEEVKVESGYESELDQYTDIQSTSSESEMEMSGYQSSKAEAEAAYEYKTSIIEEAKNQEILATEVKKKKEKIINEVMHDIISDFQNFEFRKKLEEENIDLAEALELTVGEIIEKASSDEFAVTATLEEVTKIYASVMQLLSDKEISEVIQSKASISGSVLSFVNDLTSAAFAQRFSNVFSAVAAGDEDEPKKLSFRGLWSTFMYGKSNQKSISNKSGYKGETTSGTIGFDFDVLEDHVIGVAYSNMDTNINFKNNQSGNKLLAKSHVFSLYGQAALTNKLELNGQISYAQTKVKLSSKRLISAKNYKDAIGSYNTNSLNTEANLVYNLYNKNNILLLPFLGLKYSNQHDGAYSESGAGIQNLSIASKKMQNLYGVYGAKILYTKQFANGIEISPSMIASVENALTHKSTKVRAKLMWANRYFDKNIDIAKPEKLACNIGASVLGKRNNLEMLLSYNYHFKKKYDSHQGALNIRVLF